MKLGQIKWNGGATAAIFTHKSARPIPDYTLYDLISRAEKQGASLPQLAEELSIPKPVPAEPLIPLQPREVWANYEGHHESDRPRIFLKGTARVCVGPGQPIGIRPDSHCTSAEPEIAVVLGAKGRVLGYTLANDLSAREIGRESPGRENPHYVAQSKTFHGCCALGPVMVTADEIPDPLALMVSCTITRKGEVIFSGEVSTERLGVERTVEYLMRANPVPAGSVLLTGTGFSVDHIALAEGDSVCISVDKIGELRNCAALLDRSGFTAGVATSSSLRAGAVA